LKAWRSNHGQRQVPACIANEEGPNEIPIDLNFLGEEEEEEDPELAHQ
jgi:hypothetical protein